MEEIQRIITDRYFLLNYKHLYIIGMLGTLEKQLENISSLCKNDKLEFAPVKNRQGRDFLAGFYYPPAIDITLVRHRDKESSLVAYSLNDSKTLEVVDDIIDKCGFKVSKPDKSFINAIGTELGIESGTYRIAEAISNKENLLFEKIWGAIRYMNFLAYHDLSKRDIGKLASTKFNLPSKFANIFR